MENNESEQPIQSDGAATIVRRLERLVAELIRIAADLSAGEVGREAGRTGGD